MIFTQDHWIYRKTDRWPHPTRGMDVFQTLSKNKQGVEDAKDGTTDSSDSIEEQKVSKERLYPNVFVTDKMSIQGSMLKGTVYLKR